MGTRDTQKWKSSALAFELEVFEKISDLSHTNRGANSDEELDCWW